METEIENLDSACSRRVLEVVPVVMRHIAAGVHQELEDGRWLTMGQFRLLHLIQKGVGSVSDLARCQNVSQPTISRQVDGLVKKGLVARKPDPTDRRVNHLELSDRGVELLQDLEARARRRVSEILRPFSPAEKECVYEGLGLLRSAFEQPDEGGQ
ncbi:MAG: Multidrug resistance operon repressor [Anaerolineales bacterium]|nr:Multidrug resistance operon repressor [Anaerolineales bacterium]